MVVVSPRIPVTTLRNRDGVVEMHPDYRKLPYDPKKGRRSLIVCAGMCIAGVALFFIPPVDVAVLNWHPRIEILGFVLFGIGLFNMIPSVMMLTPPEKR